MSYKRFNRHEIFNSELMTFHTRTIRNVEDYCLNNGIQMFNSVTNMLSGIWDGYLYDSLLEDAKEMNLPYEDIVRIETTIKLIEEHITANGESVTLV